MDHCEARVAEQISRCIEIINQSQQLIDESRIFLSHVYSRMGSGAFSQVAARRFISEASNHLRR